MRLSVMPNKTYGDNRIRKEIADYYYYCDIVDVPKASARLEGQASETGKKRIAITKK